MEDKDTYKHEEQIRNICKGVVKEALQAAQSVNFREKEQIELFADYAYRQAECDKPDYETFKRAYIAAYTKAQEMLVPSRSSAFSIRTMPSQIAANMLWSVKIHGFDSAYAMVRVEVEGAAGLTQESEIS